MLDGIEQVKFPWKVTIFIASCLMLELAATSVQWFAFHIYIYTMMGLFCAFIIIMSWVWLMQSWRKLRATRRLLLEIQQQHRDLAVKRAVEVYKALDR